MLCTRLCGCKEDGDTKLKCNTVVIQSLCIYLLFIKYCWHIYIYMQSKKLYSCNETMELQSTITEKMPDVHFTSNTLRLKIFKESEWMSFERTIGIMQKVDLFIVRKFLTHSAIFPLMLAMCSGKCTCRHLFHVMKTVLTLS